MKKFNWGTGIASVIVIFLIGMGVLLTIAMRQKTDLVSENYYENELNYQDRINSIRRTVNVPDAVRMIQSGDTLAIDFSLAVPASDLKGTIHFYRPSDKQKDFDVRIKLDRSGTQRIATRGMSKGLWKVQAEWNTSAGEFYTEQPLVVN